MTDGPTPRARKTRELRTGNIFPGGQFKSGTRNRAGEQTHMRSWGENGEKGLEPPCVVAVPQTAPFAQEQKKTPSPTNVARAKSPASGQAFSTGTGFRSHRKVGPSCATALYSRSGWMAAASNQQ